MSDASPDARVPPATFHSPEGLLMKGFHRISSGCRYCAPPWERNYTRSHSPHPSRRVPALCSELSHEIH